MYTLREFDSEEDENIYRVLYKFKEMTVRELYTVSESGIANCRRGREMYNTVIV